MREYVNIRLAHETKYWIELLQAKKQAQLDNDIKKGLIEDLEKTISVDKRLEGISITLIVKASTSSIIEAAYEYTKSFSAEKWKEIINEIEKLSADSLGVNIELGSLTPRLLLKSEIIEDFNEKCHSFKGDNNIRNVRLSYVIKVVVYAYYKECYN